MYVCEYVCNVCVGSYVCTCVHMKVQCFMYAVSFIYFYSSKLFYELCICIHACMRERVHISMHECEYVCVHVCVRTRACA